MPKATERSGVSPLHVLVWAALTLTAACRAPAPEPDDRSEPAYPGMQRVTSNAGGYTVWYALHPSPAPLNEPFELSVRIVSLTPEEPDDPPTELEVEGYMPDHLHGMTRRPLIRPLPDAGFEVSGMLFHMPGHWELYFDMTRGAVTERAQIDIHLD